MSRSPRAPFLGHRRRLQSSCLDIAGGNGAEEFTQLGTNKAFKPKQIESWLAFIEREAVGNNFHDDVFQFADSVRLSSYDPQQIAYFALKARRVNDVDTFVKNAFALESDKFVGAPKAPAALEIVADRELTPNPFFSM